MRLGGMIADYRARSSVPGFSQGPQPSQFQECLLIHETNMPFSIDSTREPPKISCHGCLTIEETRDVLYEQLDLRASQNRVIDLAQLESFDYDAFRLIRLCSQMSLKAVPETYRCALVATSPLSNALARMWQMLNGHSQVIIEIFSELDQANEWIEESDGDLKMATP